MGVKLVNITKVFADQSISDREVIAVNNVNLDIKDGEFVTFLGPSGCGKTTTLRVISGFETPTSGEVWISNKLVNDQPPNKRDTSMVFQSYAIFPHLSVGQNIGFGLELKGKSKKEIKIAVDEIMDVMNLNELANRRPEQLSGGQQQRVALARAIINRPSVLLFDEPLSNLDAKLRDLMRLEIRRIQQSFGITSIYVTHDQSEAMTVSDRIVVMNEGNIMQVGTPFEIYSRPSNHFVADFIGRVNFIQGRVISLTSENGFEVEFSGGNKKVIKSSTNPLTVGEDVIVTVRPESLHLSKTEKGLFNGKIVKSVYLGSVIEYEIDIGLDKPILAVTHNPVEEGLFSNDEVVNIDFSSISAHIIG